MKVAIYARYSSDLQNPRSIDDQISICKDYASKNNYQIVNIFTDAALSGSSLNRPGVQALLQSAGYDAVLCEALDRLSRDLADIATIQKNLTYADKQIITIDDGVVNDVHVGVKGMMNQMFIKQLIKKTHRGLQGKVSQGLSAGGICYGYDIDNKIVNGQVVKGGRKINLEQAEVIKRIFHEYAVNDKSPRAIATEFNRQGIPFLDGKKWNDTTIAGNRRRGTGILNNELYIGVMVWNKLRYRKNPITDKRESTIRPEHEWIRKPVPELRIIDDELWQSVKYRQKALDARNSDYKPKKRATYIMSNLITCSCCGGGVAMRNSVQYGCSTTRNKGTCNNKAGVRRDLLEKAALNAITKELLKDDVVKAFVSEYNKHLHRLIKNANASKANIKAQIIKLDKQKANLVESIKQGVPIDIIKDELSNVSYQLERLQSQSKPRNIMPMQSTGIVERFKQSVKQLTIDSLDHNARVQVSRLIEKAILKDDGEVDLVLNYEGFLDKKRPANMGESLPVVAGACNTRLIHDIISRYAA